MTTFIRPGTQQPGAFGVSYDVDRDRDRLSGAPVYNKNEHLSVQDQRRRLPIHQHRTEILYLVETHATTVVVGETGSGKTTQIPQYLHEAGTMGSINSQLSIITDLDQCTPHGSSATHLLLDCASAGPVALLRPQAIGQ